MSGFIKLHRSLLEWEWYTDNNCFRLFMHCLLKANYKDTRFKGKDIKRGQFVTSWESLAEELSLTIRQIRYAIDRLKLSQELSSVCLGGVYIVTVENYNKYQDDDRQDCREIVSENVVAMSSECLQNVSGMSSSKEDKEYNNINNNIYIPAETKIKKFQKPTIEEVRLFCLERKNKVSPERFIDHYESNGWVVGKSPMKDWRAAVRILERQEFVTKGASPKKQGKTNNYSTTYGENTPL